MKSRIIVCGLGRTGYQIFCLLKQQGAAVVGVHSEPVPSEGADVVVGPPEAAATLLTAGIQEAQTLVLTSADDTLNLAVLMQARVLNPRIRVVNRLFNTSLGDRLDRTLPNHVTMSVAALAAPVFSFAALGNLAIGQLKLFNQTWPIHEEFIHEHHPWQGRPLSDFWYDRSRMLIYYLPVGHCMDLISAVVDGKCLQVGDRLIIGAQPSVKMQRQSWMQKLLKVISSLRRFQQQTQPMLAVVLALLVTIFATTLTYVGVGLKAPVVDALYFSVGMLTGAGGQEIVVEQAPGNVKLFTVVMMLVGAAVVGICYALLNDFVLGTRFKQLWNTVQVPQRHHYIVCGLGGVGIQIASQLRSYGHDVVAIEQDSDCRFLNTAHVLKIPVIHGDASLAETLKAANLNQAAAVLVVTSNDTANLEIALTAKGINPNIPAIVRYQDAHFARMAQQVFEFEAVLSPTELAAPAFAAAALGGRILGNGMAANTLWVAIATLITPGHPFVNRCVKEAAMDADFVPLYLETSYQTVHGWDLLETRLQVGHVLYLTMPATHLEQLWRVSPSQVMAS